MSPRKPVNKTFFDWIRPSMIADKLIVPARWQAENAAAAEAEFGDPDLRRIAVVLAVLHAHVLDYIRQAPVLVLAEAGAVQADLRRREGRSMLTRHFLATAGSNNRLPQILRAYDLAPPLRRLKGAPLTISQYSLLKPLSAVAETILAQVIPEAVVEQRAWLAWLEMLARRRWPRHASRNAFLAWAAAHVRTPQQRDGTDTLADWVMFDSASFDPAMSYDQVRAGSARWHAAQAAHRHQIAFRFGHMLDTRTVDYGPLPTEFEAQGLSFHALRSAADLNDESVRMHHCVRNYWRYVARGHSFIYSIRRGEAHLATLEVHRQTGMHGTRLPLVKAQLKGPCNVDPPPRDIVQATDRFLEFASGCVIAAARAKAEAEKAGRQALGTESSGEGDDAGRARIGRVGT